jgi:hypothetical protein
LFHILRDNFEKGSKVKPGKGGFMDETPVFEEKL